MEGRMNFVATTVQSEDMVNGMRLQMWLLCRRSLQQLCHKKLVD